MTAFEIILSFLFAVALCFAVFFYVRAENYRKALSVSFVVRQNPLPFPLLALGLLAGVLVVRQIIKNNENENS